jgi:rhodanese-related sulfurtransferase
MCGKSLSDEAVSTIGEQRRYNYALQPMSKEEFVQLVAADQPSAPGYFAHDAVLNRQERASLDATMAKNMKPLDLPQVLELQRHGAQVVDTRDPVEFAGAHLKNSLNIPVDGKYATWAGTMLGKHAPIVVVADEERVSESIMRLGRIGFDHVDGYLEQGLNSLDHHENLLQATERITVVAAAEYSQPATILDVRSAQEWQTGHIPGSLNIPLNNLANRIAEVPRDRDVIVHCQGGYRSTIAASLLRQQGLDRVMDMVGGYKAWAQSKLPTQEGTPETAVRVSEPKQTLASK